MENLPEANNCADEDQFISGIFNYCDRWCERCPMTGRCGVYADTERKKQEHIRKGEDPYDWNIVMQDVKESFEEALKLVKEAAREEGIDADKLPPSDYKEPDPSGHPLYLRAKNYMQAAHEFLGKLRKTIEAEGCNLSEYIELTPSPFDKLKDFEKIKSSYETISWYHTLISVKVHRALCSKAEAETGKDKELADVSQNDADGSAKVAYDGIVRSVAALQKIYKWNEALQDEALKLMLEADRLRREIDADLPGHKTFKRPGFDE